MFALEEHARFASLFQWSLRRILRCLDAREDGWRLQSTGEQRTVAYREEMLALLGLVACPIVGGPLRVRRSFHSWRCFLPPISLEKPTHEFRILPPANLAAPFNRDGASGRQIEHILSTSQSILIGNISNATEISSALQVLKLWRAKHICLDIMKLISDAAVGDDKWSKLDLGLPVLWIEVWKFIEELINQHWVLLAQVRLESTIQFVEIVRVLFVEVVSNVRLGALALDFLPARKSLLRHSILYLSKIVLHKFRPRVKRLLHILYRHILPFWALCPTSRRLDLQSVSIVESFRVDVIQLLL